MTPISQEPKGLEPRGCEGEESLGASSFQGEESDGCREGGFSHQQERGEKNIREKEGTASIL